MHCPALVQVICSELLKTWGQKGFENHVAQVQNFYKDQRNKMLKAAETHLTGLGKSNFMNHCQFWSKSNGIANHWPYLQVYDSTTRTSHI